MVVQSASKNFQFFMIVDKKVAFYYNLGEVKNDALIVLVVGVCTNLFTILFHPLLPEMPLSIPALLGTAISILLSFKMNQSYDRWWEARKVWGSIVNDSRTLIIQLQSFLTSEDKENIEKIAYRQIAWCIVLSKSLRGLDMTEDIGTLLTEADLYQLSRHSNKPLAILQLNDINTSAVRQYGYKTV
jgi:putative membrane protein